MKIFIIKTLLFSLAVAILLALPELIIPPTLTTFRSWEAIISVNPFNVGKFYPNQNITRDEVGDLAHHTKWQIKKENIHWVTDSIGFRNKKYQKNIDILFIGASNITGSGTSQENIISEIVGKKTNFVSYNIAPSNFQKFTNLLETGIISSPKILVYGNIERNIPYYKRIKKESNIKQKLKATIGQVISVANLGVLLNKLRKRNTKSFVKAWISDSKGRGIQSNINNKMFFYQGKDALIQDDSMKIEKTSEIIKSYSKYCDSIGIKFIFCPIPNKETIYFDLVPFEEQPTYLKKIIENLSQKHVEVINTIAIFNNEKENRLLYHLDDTHWNKNAIEITADEIIRLATSYMR